MKGNDFLLGLHGKLFRYNGKVPGIRLFYGLTDQFRIKAEGLTGTRTAQYQLKGHNFFVSFLVICPCSLGIKVYPQGVSSICKTKTRVRLSS